MVLNYDDFRNFLWRCGSLVSISAMLVVGFLYIKQDSLLYFPEIGGIPRRPSDNPRGYRSPFDHKLPYETHMIQTEDGVSIHSWLILHPLRKKEKTPTIIFFHGNAGNIGLRLPNAAKMFSFVNCNVLMVEYRGYGESDSVTPCESGLKLDAEASLRFLLNHPEVDSDLIFIFGRSLGGAVGFHLAQYAQQNSLKLAGLIVENTFLSISTMVDHLMPLVAPFKRLVLKIDWDSSKITSQLTQIPILYLSGAADELVPPHHMQQLYKSSAKTSPCARMHIIKNGTHNETWVQGGMLYWQKIKSFMTEAISCRNSPTTGRNSNNSFDGSAVTCDYSNLDVDMGAEPFPTTYHDSEKKKEN